MQVYMVYVNISRRLDLNTIAHNATQHTSHSSPLLAPSLPVCLCFLTYQNIPTTSINVQHTIIMALVMSSMSCFQYHCLMV